MGQEIDAAKTVVQSRLLADSTFNNYVSGRIYDGHGPAGETDPLATYALLEQTSVEKARQTLGYTVLPFKVMVWHKIHNMASLSLRAERIRILLNGYVTTSGSYNVSSFVGAPVEERERLKAGGYRSGSGYNVLVVVQSGAYVLGGLAYFAFGTAGAETNLTAYCSRVELHWVAPKNTAGRIDSDYEDSSPGHFAAWFVVRGLWHAAADAAIRTHVGGISKGLIWGPEGNAAGKTKWSSSNAYILAYRHIAPEGELRPVEFELVIGVNGAPSWGSF